jgi:hypothetical protein
MSSKRKYLYRVTLENLTNTEEKEHLSIVQIHNFVTQILKQEYTNYESSNFVSNKTLNTLLGKTEINDYIIFKAQKTLVRIYKNLNPNYKKVLQN